MENDHDLRNVILLLVKACKMYKVRALSLNTQLSVIMSLPPTKRAALTDTDVHSAVASLLEKANGLADKESEQLETALSGSIEFLEPLRVYASRHFWDQ